MRVNNKRSWRFLFRAAFVALVPALASAEPAAPATPAAPASASYVLVYDVGTQRSDKSFTESALIGAERAREELSIPYETIATPVDGDRTALLEEASRKHPPLIVAVGFQYVRPVLAVAEKHPNVRYTVIDGIVPPLFNNVQSVIFKDHEGAFLVGMAAASVSRSGKVGFIGGMDVPIIRNFGYGFKQGAQFAVPNITVVQDTIGTTQNAWSDPAKGAELASKQFAEGVDVVFAAAGGSGLGVLHAAKQAQKYAIGVDTNQNGLFPGTVLTSMVKRVDKAVYESFKQMDDKSWDPGIKYLGLKEGALDYAVDVNNRDLLTKGIIDKLETAKDLIVRGMIEVNVYSPQ